MVAVQSNLQTFTYVDDNGTTWNKRGEMDATLNAIDGSSAFTAGAPVWPSESRRFHTRKVVWMDPTTFRTKRTVIYTAAAYAALDGSSTLAVSVPGVVAPVNYGLVEKIGEKQPVARAARQLADHA